MFRTRLAGICIAALTALSGSTLTQIAHAQEVIDLDEEAPAPKKGAPKTGAAPKSGAATGGKKVDIDLDKGQANSAPSTVTANQMTESAATAKQLFDKEK